MSKVLLIGWDGATWAYIDPLMEAGKLPHLSRLLQRGVRATLRSTIPPYTNIAWPSLVTGMGPQHTGVFDAVRIQHNSNQMMPTNVTGFKGIPLWQWVNRYGRSAGVLNVPVTYPAQPLDGYLVSGFDSPRHSPTVAYPQEILSQWAGEGRPYKILAEETALMDGQNPHQSRGDLETFVQRWVALSEQQGEFSAWLWQNYPVDLMFVVFSGTDSINHRTRDFDQIARVYQAADRALGNLLETVSDDTLICLVSDHGSVSAHRYISLNCILHDAGWIHFRPQIAARFWQRLPTILGRMTTAVWPKLPHRARQILSWPFLRWDPRLAVGYDNIDWTRTTVYARSGLGPLYIDQQGSREYEALRQTVIDYLLSVQDQDGRSLFQNVWRREKLYPDADPADDPPDLIFQPADWRDHVITGYPSDPPVRSIPATAEYGTHTPDGILLLAGPGVRSGQDLTSADIVDVVPTLLAAWQLPIPEQVNGRVLQQAFQTSLSVKKVKAESTPQPNTSKASEEVLQRLRSLGYLE